MYSLPVKRPKATLHCVSLATTTALGLTCTPARAVEVQNYGFAAAAQEVTQLFCLAETANACGWASAQDIEQFKVE